MKQTKWMLFNYLMMIFLAILSFSLFAADFALLNENGEFRPVMVVGKVGGQKETSYQVWYEHHGKTKGGIVGKRDLNSVKKGKK